MPKGKIILKRWLKEIKKEAIELLEKKNVILNSSKGYVDKFGNVIGFYRTRNKRYIEDKYVNIAEKFKDAL